MTGDDYEPYIVYTQYSLVIHYLNDDTDELGSYKDITRTRMYDLSMCIISLNKTI